MRAYKGHDRRAAALLLAAGCGLSGCLGSTAPSRFYLLSPIDGEAPAAPTTELEGPSVYLAAVELPGYLLDPQIATRIDRNELEFAEYDRWGESLDHNAANVLQRNLELLLPDSQIGTYLWERPVQTDRLVTVVVSRFDAQGGEVSLTARWAVSRGERAGPAELRRSEFTQPVEGEGYAAIVGAMSDALAALSRDIAAEIQSP